MYTNNGIPVFLSVVQDQSSYDSIWKYC